MLLARIVKYSVVFAILYLLFLAITLYQPHRVPKSEWKASRPPYPSNKASNIFWFVQISDIHISRFYDKKRAPDFKTFCSRTLDAIDPEVVLVTGDLTDAKHRNLYDSEQFLDEWQTYNKVLQDTKVLEKYVWLDLRGNHDVFNILSDNSPSNFYASLSGSKGKLSSSKWDLIKPFGKYSFIPVDASIMPGPRRPFNFMGHLSAPAIKKLQMEGEASKKSNLSVWYGHYTTPTVSSAAIGLRSVLGQFGAVYLCGHMHDVGGLFPHLQAMHPSGFLELEVKDWKWNRYYRVMAVDHDLISYVDVKFDEWPVVLITNPKPARDMIPKHEPIGRIRKSSHIRFLVFSLHPITQTYVTVDGIHLNESPMHVKGPLWACKWNPSLYHSGVHQLNVTVEDESGAVQSTLSQFSLDDEWPVDFKFYATVILLTDFCTLSKVGFALLVATAIVTIIFVKLYGVRVSNDKSFVPLWLFRLQILISDDFTFYTLLLFLFNLAIGPHFIGEIVTGHIGACFVYGLLIDGHLVVENFLYIYTISAFVFHYTAAIVYLSYVAEIRWIHSCKFVDSFTRGRSWLCHVLFVYVLLCHCYTCAEVYLSYGLMSMLVSPSKLWWTVTFILLTVRTWIFEHRLVKRL